MGDSKQCIAAESQPIKRRASWRLNYSTLLSVNLQHPIHVSISQDHLQMVKGIKARISRAGLRTFPSSVY